MALPCHNCFIWTWRVIVCAFVCQRGLCQTAVKYTVMDESPKHSIVGFIFRDTNIGREYPPNVRRQLRLEIVNQAPKTAEYLFFVEPANGILRTNKTVDRETYCPHAENCTVQLDLSVSPIKYFQKIKVVVQIVDINDNKPVFAESHIERFISEATTAGTAFTLPTADDKDAPKYGVVRYQLEGDGHMFSLDYTQEGPGISGLRLNLNTALDREITDKYTLKVIAYDGGQPAKSATLTVNIIVLDINDNSPGFLQQQYSVTIPEDYLVGRPFLTVKALDPDHADNGEVSYSLNQRTVASVGHLFEVNDVTGELSAKQPLDRETLSEYRLFIRAHDKGPEALSDQTIVQVILADVNDNAPVVTVHGTDDSGAVLVRENDSPGSTVAHISVTDPDSGKNGTFSCTVSDAGFSLTRLSQGEYRVNTLKALDYESQAEYSITFECEDEGTPVRRTEEVITIQVQDENDNPPDFNNSLYSVEIEENNDPDAFIEQVRATDKDSGSNSQLYYTLSPEVSKLFTIDHRSGVIASKVSLDHELTPAVQFTVFVTDGGRPSLSSNTTVLVNVIDLNDEDPVFTETTFTFNITGPLYAGSFVGQVMARDPDSPPYNDFIYSLEDTEQSKLFHIYPETGVIICKSDVNFHDVTAYTMSAVVSSLVYPYVSNNCTVVVKSINSTAAAAHAAWTEHHNLIIVVVLVTVSSLCIAALITSICYLLVKAHRQQRTAGKEAASAEEKYSEAKALTVITDVSDMVTSPGRTLAEAQSSNYVSYKVIKETQGDESADSKDTESAGSHEGTSSTCDSGRGTSEDGDMSLPANHILDDASVSSPRRPSKSNVTEPSSEGYLPDKHMDRKDAYFGAAKRKNSNSIDLTGIATSDKNVALPAKSAQGKQVHFSPLQTESFNLSNAVMLTRSPKRSVSRWLCDTEVNPVSGSSCPTPNYTVGTIYPTPPSPGSLQASGTDTLSDIASTTSGSYIIDDDRIHFSVSQSRHGKQSDTMSMPDTSTSDVYV